MLRIVVWVVLIALSILPFLSLAEEPCRRDGSRVVCDAASFDALMDRCVDAMTETKTCAVKLEAAVKDRDAALEKCATVPVPAPAPKPPPSSMQPLVGFLMGVVGAAVAVMTPFVDASTGTQAAAIFGGVALVGSGFMLVLSVD